MSFQGTPEERVIFGSRLRWLRRRAGLTQRQLADRLGLDFTYMSKLENSRGEPPAEETIKRMADVLDDDPEFLLALAGKISGELREMAAENPEFATLLRRLPDLPPDVLRRLYREAGVDPSPDNDDDQVHS